MKTIIIGEGEIGNALLKIFSQVYETDIRDKESDIKGTYNIMHIAFPYFDGFIEAVKEYQEMYSPLHTIIHSTVPIGTSRKCNAYNSPVSGVHPNLVDGLFTFPKFIAPHHERVKTYFNNAGISTVFKDKQEDTEAAKLWDTTYYGWCIMFEKAVHTFCEEHGLDFDTVYTEWNNYYNSGYTTLGKLNVRRPVLNHMDGPIGGHCVIPNAKLLNNVIPDVLLEYNKYLQDKKTIL